MKEKWLTTREAAEIQGIDLRNVKRNAANGKYILKKGKTPNGQTGYLIAFSSLPIAATKARKTKRPAEKPDELSGCNEKQKLEAFQRLDILRQWEKFSKKAKESQDAAAENFVRIHLEGKFSRTTLYRWKRDFQEHGILGLIPDWNNGKKAFDEEGFQAEAKLRAQQLFLTPARVTYKGVFDLLSKEAILKDWQIPSYDTLKRFLQTIPMPARIMLREGRKACDDKAAPAIIRNLNGLAAMEIIESDHHQVDVAVIDKEGHVFFPWLTIWFDVRSRRPLGWILSSTPNSDGIRIALYKTIMEYGVPKEVHIDNGKDYRRRSSAVKTAVSRRKKPSLKTICSRV
jgi:transposase